MQKNFDPDKKDDVIVSLISHYGWGNNDSLIQNLATTFVNLLVQYPSCVPLSNAQFNESCSYNQRNTLFSFSKGIMEYRCNVDRPSEALSSETPPSEAASEVPPSENPPGKTLTTITYFLRVAVQNCDRFVQNHSWDYWQTIPKSL